jgi:hypothetical protein
MYVVNVVVWMIYLYSCTPHAFFTYECQIFLPICLAYIVLLVFEKLQPYFLMYNVFL